MIRFLLILLMLLQSCETSTQNGENHPTIFVGQAMTMHYRVLIGGHLNEKQKEKVRHIITTTFNEVDLTYNKWNPKSEVSALNRSPANKKIKLSDSLYAFLQKTDKLVKLSEYKFDPTIESIEQLWKRNLIEGKLPSENEISELAPSVGWNKVHLENGYFWKDNHLLQLDLGGIAKGYAIDLIVERLNAAGYKDVYVEWGGEIRTSGEHPEKRPWKIFVATDDSTDFETALTIVSMEDSAVASSGDYLQKWTVDGVTYFHIIDPMTLKPLIATDESICCATVMANDCMTADVLATTAMLFPNTQEASVWLESVKEKIPDIQYWMGTREKLKKPQPP